MENRNEIAQRLESVTEQMEQFAANQTRLGEQLHENSENLQVQISVSIANTDAVTAAVNKLIEREQRNTETNEREIKSTPSTPAHSPVKRSRQLSPAKITQQQTAHEYVQDPANLLTQGQSSNYYDPIAEKNEGNQQYNMTDDEMTNECADGLNFRSPLERLSDTL